MAFLDLMIESAQNGVVMNDNDIKEEVDTIMFEVRKQFITFNYHVLTVLLTISHQWRCSTAATGTKPGVSPKHLLTSLSGN